MGFIHWDKWMKDTIKDLEKKKQSEKPAEDKPADAERSCNSESDKHKDLQIQG